MHWRAIGCRGNRRLHWPSWTNSSRRALGGCGGCRRCPIGSLVALVARSRPDYDAGSLITGAAAINLSPWGAPLLRPAFSLRLMLGLWPPRLRIWRKRPSSRISLPREKGRAGARPQSVGFELLAKSERKVKGESAHVGHRQERLRSLVMRIPKQATVYGAGSAQGPRVTLKSVRRVPGCPAIRTA